MQYSFSVVIPTYNRSAILQSTLQSLLQQTYPLFEVVVVDDGGTDDTASVVKALADDRIRYFWKPNGERGAARNFGTQKATGDYIFYLDSDDQVKPGYLAYANELANANNTPAAIHIPYNILLDGVEQEGTGTPGNIAKRIFIQNQFACQVIIRRDIAQAVTFSENRDFLIGEDWYYIIKIAADHDFVIGDRRLGLIIQHTERSMRTVEPEKVLQSRDIFLEYLKQENKPAYIIRNVNYELTNLAALQAVLHRKNGMAFRLMLRSCRIKPAESFRRRNFAILKKILFN